MSISQLANTPKVGVRSPLHIAQTPPPAHTLIPMDDDASTPLFRTVIARHRALAPNTCACRGPRAAVGGLAASSGLSQCAALNAGSVIGRNTGILPSPKNKACLMCISTILSIRSSRLNGICEGFVDQRRARAGIYTKAESVLSLGLKSPSSPLCACTGRFRASSGKATRLSDECAIQLSVLGPAQKCPHWESSSGCRQWEEETDV